MNSVDLLVLVVVLLNGAIGAYRGFTWQLFRLGSLVLAFWLSHRFAVQLADEPLKDLLGWDSTACRVLAWTGIFAGTYLVMALLGRWLRGLIERARLTSSDRSLGFLLGSVKGVVFVALAFQILIIFNPVLPDFVKTQLWGDPAREIPPSQAALLHRKWLANRLNNLIPPEMGEQVRQGIWDSERG